MVTVFVIEVPLAKVFFFFDLLIHSPAFTQRRVLEGSIVRSEEPHLRFGISLLIPEGASLSNGDDNICLAYLTYQRRK